jgi:hypothetical protein
MNKKIVLASLLSFLALMIAFQTAEAAVITTASLDEQVYVGGETGYVYVSIYNDKNEKIRVTELTTTISYYYSDSTAYVQKFFTSNTLPEEILAGQTETLTIPISLPTNIASGYMNPSVEARTELWNEPADEWRASDRATYTVKLYVESPYKQLYETSQDALLDERNTNANLTTNMTMLAVTTVTFAAIAGLLMYMMYSKRVRPVPQAQS